MKTILISLLLLSCMANAQGMHDDLIDLFTDWREFEQPPLLDGAPEYTVETCDRRDVSFQGFKSRLE